MTCNPPSIGNHKYIIVVIDYFTKWVEAIPTMRANDVVIMDFLKNNILSRFGCPRILVTDNEPAFNSRK